MPERTDDAHPPVVPSFWGALLVLWAVAEGTTAAVLLLSAARGNWPAYSFGLIEWLRFVGAASGMPLVASMSALLIAVWFLLAPMALTGFWEHRRRAGVAVSGSLLMLGWLAKQAGAGGEHHRLVCVAWLMIGVGAAGIVLTARRAVPRASRGLIALVAVAVLAQRAAVLAVWVAVVQIAWTFLTGRRVLVKRRDTRRKVDLRRRRRAWLELGAVVLLAVAYPIAGNLVRPDQPPTPTTFLVAIPYELGIGLVVLALLLRDPQFPAQVPRTRVGWLYELGFGVWLCLLGITLEYVVAGLVVWLPNKPGYWDSLDYTPAMRTALAIGSLFSAFHEEMIFRAFLVTRLRPLVGTAASIVGSSALFALVHGYSLAATLPVFALGVLMAVAFVRTRSLTRIVIAHWLINVVTFVAWR